MFFNELASFPQIHPPQGGLDESILFNFEIENIVVNVL